MPKAVTLNYRGKGVTGTSLSRVALHAGEVFGQPRLDGWVNKLIFADNLLALRTLVEDPEVAGEVRLVYIDPPFATNHTYRAGLTRTATVSASSADAPAYQDLLVGPEYLEFIRERLVLLRRILADDGSIYVHIDCKMGHYVKVLLDGVFGQERFINDIARVKCNPKNFQRKGYGNFRDMLLFYSKTATYVWNEAREEMSEADIGRLFPKVDPQGRRYTTTPLHAPGETKNGDTGREWRGLRPPPGRHWRHKTKELARLERLGLVEWSSTGNPRKRIYADAVLKSGKKRQDVWYFKDPPSPSYPTEKNLEMLETIVLASSNPGDLVLDCFAGSGTTLEAAEAHGRRWIGIENSKVAIETAKKRLLRIPRVGAFQVLRAASREPVGAR